MGNIHSIFFNHNTQFKKIPYIWTVPERELFEEIANFDTKLTGQTEFSFLKNILFYLNFLKIILN